MCNYLSYNVIRITVTEVKVVEKGKAVLYPHPGKTASVRRVHGIIEQKAR